MVNNCKLNLFSLPLLILLQKDKWLISHSLTYLQITQLKHFSVTFSHFLLIDLYIRSFQSMKYLYFHVQLYHTFQSQRTFHLLTFQKCTEIICTFT